MKRFNKITIVGVGLLGGSIGLAVKKKGLACQVTGFFRDKKKIRDAIKLGAIDNGTDDFINAVDKSDLIILCSPVGDIISKLKLLKKIKANQAIITDIGSTKADIAKTARGLNFIGSHPIAGSEQSGISHAKTDIFSNSICILTPANRTKKESLRRIAEFWRLLGAEPIILKPETHDRILAFTSHLPHAAAFSLMGTVPNEILKFSAGGLKDTTRIALSSPQIWADIFMSNKKNALKAISIFEKNLKRFKILIAGNDRRKLLLFLKKAQHKRSSMIQTL